MWEFEHYDARIFCSSPALRTLADVSTSFKINNIRTASLIFWTEHCSECAYPSCYETCDLYEPRFDLHCRTLQFGMKRDFSFSGIRPYSALVVPKEWATLDAIISLSQIPFAALRVAEVANDLTAYICKGFSTLFSKLSPKKKILRGFERFRTLLIDALGAHGQMPEAFLLQVLNGSEEECSLSIKLTNFPKKQNFIYFQKRFSLLPGINEFVISFSEISNRLDLKGFIRGYMSFQSKEPIQLFFGAADFISFRDMHHYAIQGIQKGQAPQKIKCLVWDLDNTIWEGILLEHPEGVKLRKNVTQLLQMLDDRGVLHSIASKNNYEDAITMLKRLGIQQFFLYPQINWQPKSESIKEIVEKLNIGINTIAFVDDSQFELKEVASQLPEVLTINAGEMGSITNNPRFSGSASSDSSKRRYFYKAEEKRKHMHSGFSGSYQDFLLSCHMKIEVRYPKEDDIERLHELVQRTNQLNFTGNRYSRGDITNMIDSTEHDCFLITCSDDFGEYGSVGFCIVALGDNDVTCKELAISCRVQGKRVEQMFFKTIMQIYKQQGKDPLRLVFRETERNTPARVVIKDMGFKLFSNEGETSIFCIQMSNYVEIADTAEIILSLDK